MDAPTFCSSESPGSASHALQCWLAGPPKEQVGAAAAGRSRARSALAVACMLKARGGILNAILQCASCLLAPVAVARR